MNADHDFGCDSYYAASAYPTPRRPALASTETADVCVIGGGLAGLSTALELVERGLSVVLLEGERVGFGASGRSGAQLIQGYACSQEKLEGHLGFDGAKALWDMSLESLDIVRDRVARHAIDCDLTWGHMHCAIKPRQRKDLIEWQGDTERRYGYDKLRFVEREELGTMLGTSRYLAGVFDSNSGHCHPLNYTLGLARAAEAAGVRIFEGSRAISIDQGDTVTVRTSHGAVRARHVALAGNCYLEGLVPALQRKIMSVGTYIIATEQLDAERARSLIANGMAVSDVNWVLDYFRLSADHRLLFGGRVSYSGLDPLGTRRATRARMLKVFPQLTDVEVEYAWGGFVDITMNRAPHFGRIAPNVYFVQGFSGHGMALTALAGRLMAEAIAGQAGRLDVFSRITHYDFPGGMALRRPALVLAMLWFRLRDLL